MTPAQRQALLEQAQKLVKEVEADEVAPATASAPSFLQRLLDEKAKPAATAKPATKAQTAPVGSPVAAPIKAAATTPATTIAKVKNPASAAAIAAAPKPLPPTETGPGGDTRQLGKTSVFSMNSMVAKLFGKKH